MRVRYLEIFFLGEIPKLSMRLQLVTSFHSLLLECTLYPENPLVKPLDLWVFLMNAESNDTIITGNILVDIERYPPIYLKSIEDNATWCANSVCIIRIVQNTATLVYSILAENARNLGEYHCMTYINGKLLQRVSTTVLNQQLICIFFLTFALNSQMHSICILF